MLKKEYYLRKRLKKRMPDLKNKPKESIQETSYSGKKLELTPKQQVRKQNLKKDIHVKRILLKSGRLRKNKLMLYRIRRLEMQTLVNTTLQS